MQFFYETLFILGNDMMLNIRVLLRHALHILQMQFHYLSIYTMT